MVASVRTIRLEVIFVQRHSARRLRCTWQLAHDTNQPLEQLRKQRRMDRVSGTCRRDRDTDMTSWPTQADFRTSIWTEFCLARVVCLYVVETQIIAHKVDSRESGGKLRSRIDGCCWHSGARTAADILMQTSG